MYTEISAVSDIENAKRSDRTSTAGEHNLDRISDIESNEHSNDEMRRENDKQNFIEIKKDDEMKINSKILNEELIIV
ncbi:unnamed protein product [Adineta steineri]|uniref:Uncharacterized protein n=1 Tax=Adineta steineri TaxID=433720 RepID=A0A815CZK3_9BILA|nr:unnamed protein product [Adineta steineri]CAF3923899.1 unnamed protein product [Adineta steineri]